MDLAAEVVAYLDRGGVVVSASLRAARALQHQYALAKRRQGARAWRAAHILEWDTWLHELWRWVPGDERVLLNGSQEHLQWRRILERDGAAAQVVSADGLATLAREAYARLSAYRAHDARRRPWGFTEHGKADAERFREWAAGFDALCERQGWLSASRLSEVLAEQMERGELELPRELAEEVRLLGFDRLTPAQQRLVDALEGAGCRTSRIEVQPAATARNTQIIAGGDVREEIAACALWLRDRLEAGDAERIGVVVADVDSLRGEIARVFRRVLGTEAGDDRDQAFEFSLGVPLAATPLARAALLFLRWLEAPLGVEEALWLGTSGLLARREGEVAAVARLDASMRDKALLQPEMSMATYAERALDRCRNARAWCQRLRDLSAALESEKRQTPRRGWGQWAQWSLRSLTVMGWPGYLELDSQQYQVRKKFLSVLDSMAVLDLERRPVTFGEFVSALARQAEETIFAPESGGAPIQVMGALETAGQAFDAVWVMQFNDAYWPQSGRPHALIPAALQRERGMPHGSPQIDRELSERIAVRLHNTGGEVVFSYADNDDFGGMRPSPLLDVLFAEGWQPVCATDRYPEIRMQGFAPAELETVSDGAIPYTPGETAAGGSDVLKMQAACPFQAFASKRLQTRALEPVQRGLSPAERGKLLHEALETLWDPEQKRGESLRSSDRLKAALEDGSLEGMLRTSVHLAIERIAEKKAADGWLGVYLASEEERLVGILSQWLRQEALREPFEVLATEQEIPAARVSGLTLKLRADRIDRLADGTHFLLDYKTGEVSPEKWEGPRPDEPQLPLYATFGEIERVSGALFAQIRAGSIELKGRVSDGAQRLGARFNKARLISEPLDDAVSAEWRAALESLADEFLSGESRVAPKDFPKTCRFCPLPQLCRVRELGMLPRDEEDESVEELRDKPAGADAAEGENGDA